MSAPKNFSNQPGSENKKNAPVPALTGPEQVTPTEDPTTESDTKQMSSTTISQTTVVDQKALGDWIEQVRAIHTEATKPFIENDPRLLVLEAEFGSTVDRDEWGDEFLLDRYFVRHVHLPEIKMDVPLWVERDQYRLGSYPCINVGLASKRFIDGEQYAEVEQWIDIYVEDYDADLEGFYYAGHVRTNEPVIQTERDEYSVRVAIGMINSMDEAVAHLRENS